MACYTIDAPAMFHYIKGLFKVKFISCCQQNYENVSSEVWKINPSEDVVTAAKTRGEPRGPSQQILYDCYVSTISVKQYLVH